MVECAVSECAGEMDFVSQGSEGYILPENSAGKKQHTKLKLKRCAILFTALI